MKSALFLLGLFVSLGAHAQNLHPKKPFDLIKGTGNCPRQLKVADWGTDFYINDTGYRPEYVISNKGLGAIFNTGVIDKNSAFQDNGFTYVSVERVMSQPCSRVGKRCEKWLTDEKVTAGWNASNTKFRYKGELIGSAWDVIPINEPKSEKSLEFDCVYRVRE